MKTIIGGSSFLRIYSGVLTVAFAVTVFAAFRSQTKKVNFEEITVQRINIVEPDGTLRMVISDTARFPGIIIKGKERPHPNRRTGGVLFFNDEGTENGGLTFGGSKDKDGKTSSYGHLSFDRYEQDQVFSIDASEDGPNRRSRVSLVDYPDYSITELMDEIDRIKPLPQTEQQVELKKFFAKRGEPHQRLLLGRDADKSVAMRLKDTEGRDRLVVMVKPDGSPVLQFLDEGGKVVSQLPAAK
jgi:hypothetical protein